MQSSNGIVEDEKVARCFASLLNPLTDVLYMCIYVFTISWAGNLETKTSEDQKVKVHD